jgi:hypothetical protein
MQRIKVLALALVAMLVLGAVAVAYASAATEILPTPTVAAPLTFTDVQVGEHTFETLSGSTLKCKSGTGTGAFTTVTLGTFKVSLNECKGPLGTTCTGTGDAAGVILTSGEVHYALALLTESKTKVDALVFLQEQFHFTCKLGTIEQLILMRGCYAAHAAPIESLAAETEDNFKLITGQKGDPDISSWIMPGGEELTCVLESSINGGAFEGSGFSGVDKSKEFKKSGLAVTALLHK